MLNLPKELLTQIAYGNCVVMMGNGTDARNRWRSFADELAELCDYPSDKPDRSLPAVARIYQATMGGPQHGRQALVARLREWLGQDGRDLIPLHRALVELPVKRIVDWSYDRRIEMVLREAEHRHTVVVQDHELRHRFKSSHFGKKIGLHFLTKLPQYRTRKHQKVALIGSKRTP